MTLCPDCFGELKIEPDITTGELEEGIVMQQSYKTNLVECPKCGWRRIEKVFL